MGKKKEKKLDAPDLDDMDEWQRLEKWKFGKRNFP